jgi:hypothetical protein
MIYNTATTFVAYDIIKLKTFFLIGTFLKNGLDIIFPRILSINYVSNSQTVGISILKELCSQASYSCVANALTRNETRNSV